MGAAKQAFAAMQNAKPIRSNALIGITIAALACFATLAVLNMDSEDSMTWMAESVTHDDPKLPKLPAKTAVEKVADPLAPSPPMATTLKNLIDFRAYCMAAYTDARDEMKNRPAPTAEAQLLHFIADFGQTGHWEGNGVAKLPKNIVTEYANLIAVYRKYNAIG